MNLSSLKNYAIKMRNFFYDTLFPINCVVCGLEGNWLCNNCIKDIQINKKQYCLNCKTTNITGSFCSRCKNNFYLDRVIIIGDYQDINLKKLIKLLKYKFAFTIAPTLVSIIIIFLNSYLEKEENFIFNPSDFIIIPVPLHVKREKWRGFNQAELISKELEKRINSTSDNYNLIRTKHRKPQTKLNKQRREKNTKNCYKWQGQKITKKILLIDDVTTTGATLNECAKILKENGAKEVWALALANG